MKNVVIAIVVLVLVFLAYHIVCGLPGERKGILQDNVQHDHSISCNLQ